MEVNFPLRYHLLIKRKRRHLPCRSIRTRREHLSSYVCQLRQRRGLTQEEMAEKLRITARAYGDLERGKFCFSAPALMALLLILKEDEVAELLNDFRKITEKLDGKEVA